MTTPAPMPLGELLEAVALAVWPLWFALTVVGALAVSDYLERRRS